MSTDRSQVREPAGPPTSGRATIYSVAERAGVSIATVSRVLSGTTVTSPEATEKVLRAAHELAYVPQNSAKSLASARYQTHAVVIGSFDGPYYSELLMGYEEVAARYDQELLLVVADRPRRSRTLADLRARVDGVMIAQMDIPDDEVAALARLIPVVLVGRSEIDGCDGVVSESIRHRHRAHPAPDRHGMAVAGWSSSVIPPRSIDVAARHDGFRARSPTAGLEAGRRAAARSVHRAGRRARRPTSCCRCRPTRRAGLRQRRGRPGSRSRLRRRGRVVRVGIDLVADRLGRRDRCALRHPRSDHRPSARPRDGRPGRRAAAPTGRGSAGPRRPARAAHRGGDPAVLRLH